MNKFRSLVMYFVLTVVTIVLLFGIGGVERRLDRQVAEHHLRFTGQIENAPPMVAFTTIALGSFRGLVADLLWLRAGSLQEQGNYFEMVQLARWITDLQPTFSGATAYLAWNMAYNISVTCSSFEERWRWVNEGVKLIRDQAIEYNPEDPILYKELAWIFLHKLGNIMDDANLYYKNQLAIQLASIVGGNPDWNAMAAAPTGEKAFMKRFPAEDPLWKEVADAGIVGGYAGLYDAFKSADPAALPARLAARLADRPALVEELTNYFRAEYLRRRLKLEAAMIVEINEKYGAMDWRVPESQAIYWASMGIKRTPGNRNLDCDRIITQALYEAFRSGRILMLDEKAFESIMVVPNLALVDAVFRTYTEAQEEYDKGRSMSTFRSARINFMKDAVVKLYNFGKFSKAEEYYKKLVKEDGPQVGGGSLENFVMVQFADAVKNATVKQANGIVVGLLTQSVIYLLYNDQDAAVANERMARFVYVRYETDMGNTDRTRLPPYDEMKKGVVDSILKNLEQSGRADLAAALRQKIEEDQAAVAEQSAESAPAKK